LPLDPESVQAGARAGATVNPHAAGEIGRLERHISQAARVLAHTNDASLGVMECVTGLKHMAEDNLMARILYIDLLASVSDVFPQNDGGLSQRSRERLQGVIDHGALLLARLPMDQSLLLLGSVHRAASSSPLASCLYLHMLLAHKPGAEPREQSPMHSSRTASRGPSRSSSPALIKSNLPAQMTARSSVSRDSPQRSPNDSLATQMRLRDDLRRLLSECRAALRSFATAEASEAGEGRAASDADIEQMGHDDAFSLLLKHGQDMLSDLPGDLAEELVGTIREATSPLGVSLRNHCVAGELPKVCAHAQGKRTGGGQRANRAREWHTAQTLTTDNDAGDGRRHLLSIAGSQRMGKQKRAHTSTSRRSESSDPNCVNLVAKKSAVRAPCDNRNPDIGQRLSKQFKGLELRTAVLRDRVAALDRMNADPFKPGTRAWRLSKQDAHVSPEKRTLHLPPLDGPSSSALWPLQISLPCKALKSAQVKLGAIFALAEGHKMSQREREEELEREKELLYADANTVNDVIQIQRRWRGVLHRTRYREMALKFNTAVALVRAYRSLKMSELNIMLRKLEAGDYVTRALASEANHTQAILSELSAAEARQLEMQKKESEEEFERLKEAEQQAIRELAEAEYARGLMEKEKGEMNMWKQRAERTWETFLELKHEYGIVDGSEEDHEENYKENYPEVFKAFRQATSVRSRFKKETTEYEAALRDLEQEQAEANKAIACSNEEQMRWKAANELARQKQALLEAHEIARKFTDPRVSIKERFRALSKSNSEARRFIVQSHKGKTTHSIPCNLGIIEGPQDKASHSNYAGEFCIVQDVQEDKLYEAYSNALSKGDADGLTPATLIAAMANVGRRLNNDEADRLVKSFDDDGNGTIDFQEFTQVCAYSHLAMAEMGAADVPVHRRTHS